MMQLLHRLGYVYKKPRLIPGKANAEQQREFVEYYQPLKAKKAPDDPIYFMDATHPQHNPIADMDGSDVARIINSQRHRSTTHQPQWRYRLRWTMPNHSLLTRSMHNPRIELIFLPPYAPDLNLIERYWRFFKKEILYGKYYQTFALFKQACDDCFAASNGYREALRSLLTDNFQIIDCA
ncbi:transposase [Nitrosomonas communis]